MRQRSERYRPVCCILLASGSRQQQSALALLATPKQRIPSNFLFARGSVGQSLEADFLQGQRSILVTWFPWPGRLGGTTGRRDLMRGRARGRLAACGELPGSKSTRRPGRP